MTAASGRVLIADDGPQIREWLRDFLTSQGYEVAAVATGAQLLDAVPTFQPDVIVVDMVMPGFSGTDVLAALRRGGLTMPVILISSRRSVLRVAAAGLTAVAAALGGCLRAARDRETSRVPRRRAGAAGLGIRGGAPCSIS
jgi:CheY-like chemotaxis protein